jgi:hypothetical protein
MEPVRRALGLARGQREQDGAQTLETEPLKVEPGQQGRPALHTRSTMVRPRERSAVRLAWVLSLLINALCVIVFMITFRSGDVSPAKTPDADIPANAMQQAENTLSNPLIPQPVTKAASQKQQPVAPASPPISKKKQQEEKYKKELRRVQQEFLQNQPK